MACAGRSKGTSAPTTPSPETVAPVSMALLGGSEGFVPGDDSLDRLLDSPEVAEAGQRLLERLGNDPQLQPLYEGFTSRLATHPALMKALTALIEQLESPDQDPLTLAIARVSSALDGPQFDAALDQTFDRLLDRPDVDAAFERIAESLVDQARFGDRIGALLIEWQPELEAALGLPMDHEDFPARLQAHVEQPDRNRALHDLLAARMLADPSVREGLAAILDDEAFFAACAALVTSLFGSPDFESHTVDVLVVMLEQADTAQMKQRLDEVLVTPAMEQAVVTWADQVIASEAFLRFGDQLGKTLEDPNLQAELFDVLVGSPTRATARAHGSTGSTQRRS